MEDTNPGYESANAESNLGNQATDRNTQRQNVDDENFQSNSFDYDYDAYDYMG